METSTMIYVGIGLVVVLAGIYFFFYQKDKKGLAPLTPSAPYDLTRQYQLQAYERLVLLAERISIPNVISRSTLEDSSSWDKTAMQLFLAQAIKQEFDFNIPQQIYVSTEAWDAVRNLKEQNIHLINQMASILPAEASGIELNRKLLDFVSHQQNGSLHTLVQQALSHEAKKALKF